MPLCLREQRIWQHPAAGERFTNGLLYDPLLRAACSDIGYGAFHLVVMQVARRAALLSERILENEETTAVPRRQLEVNGANAKPSMLTELVFACHDVGCGRHTGCGLHRFVHICPPYMIDTDRRFIRVITT